ncbi:hypothetical protein LSH36_410g01007 [Paralvinella palmiformis]|uniref:DUF7043 domain-containing protein n=1 Tax=Paralvinella palmiformis TaxID=53620 RepID=A0AAD9N0B5_9ANNE|nr:hypothetical protein LSH36_410g01007 [Paralvinella palmiformis]
MDLHLVVAILCHMLAILNPVLGICRFPEFAQTDDKNRDWRSGIRSQFRKLTVKVTIQNSKMTVTSSEAGVVDYERICVQSLSNFRYITAHEQSGQRRQKFACVQFLQRSDSVIQLKVSEISGSMSGICDESKLRLDPWLLLDKNSVLDERHLCSLTGGYSVKLFDREYSRGFCDAYKDHVWLESECVPGSGLYFNFRYPRCIPNVLMSEQQRTMCVANWTEDGYAFSLLRHDVQRYTWLLRYPANVRHLDSFVALLMRDMYASTESHITGLPTYVQMDMVRDIPHPVTSLCIDEFEGCNYYTDPCSDGGKMALTCARTCEVCNVTRPRMCTFSDSWIGDWIDPSHGDRLALTVEPHILTVHYNRLQQRFHCIRWDEPYTGSANKHTSYRMLVTEFSNGCRPKYSCIKVVQRSSSAILFLQLSAERHWPITDTVTQPIDCSRFSYEGDTDSLIQNRYRSKHLRLLYSKSLDTGTTCNMPLSGSYNYTAKLSDHSRCSGRITISSSGASLSVVFSNCDMKNAASHLVPERHSCIESTRLFGSDYIVVTRGFLDTEQLYCWIFPKRSIDDFYLVKSAHCNDGTRRRITRGHFVPLASFSSDSGTQTGISSLPIPVQSTPILTESSKGYVIPIGDSPPMDSYPPEVRSPTGGKSPVVDMTPSLTTGNRNTSSPKDGNKRNSTSRPPPNPATYASPIVVVAAIIFFVIFQIPCLCKNS